MNIKTKTMPPDQEEVLLNVVATLFRPKVAQSIANKFSLKPQRSLDNFPGLSENFAAVENSFNP